MTCLDCNQTIYEKDGYYGRIEIGTNKYLGSVCNKCVFEKMTQDEKIDLVKMLRGE